MIPEPTDEVLCRVLEGALDESAAKGPGPRAGRAGSRGLSALRAVLSRHAGLLRREAALRRTLDAEARRAAAMADAVSALAACPDDPTEAEIRELARRLERAIAVAPGRC